MRDDYLHKNILNKNTINERQLIDQYYNLFPNVINNKEHAVIFGTSGHRGSSKQCKFNEAHVLAISQAIVNVRIAYGIHGPCYVSKDTHILSEPAFVSVLEVLTANCIHIIIQKNNEYTPTPVISYAIVHYNNKKEYNYNFSKKADGIIVTSSHNPPEDGGIKYTSVFGGPASVSMTKLIEKHANNFLINNLRGVNRITLNKALKSGYIHNQNFIQHYVKNLHKIVNMQAIKASGLKLGVDPLSGTSLAYWQHIAQDYKLDLTIIEEKIDRTFSFMKVDYDGRIRVDCSSDLTLNSRLLNLSKDFDLFFINDPDCDRHGIMTSFGLMKSNYYFAIVIHYLFCNRPFWNNKILYIGKTNVSSIIIDHIACIACRTLIEVPVGFKWFAKGLFHGNLGFAGEDQAGASFLDYYGMPWSTDKDGLIMCLLAAETVAVTNQPLQEYYKRLHRYCDISDYGIVKIVISDTQKDCIQNTLFNQIRLTELAGDPIIAVKNIIPTNTNKTMNGIKIITRNGWIACRLSGTESIYKIYCESFLDSDHRKKIQTEIVKNVYDMFNQL